MLSLSGKKALVTGGARGIGKAISEALWRAGANVAVFGRNEAAAQDFCRTLSNGATNGRLAAAYRVDVADSSAVAAAVKKVGKDFGGLDIVVNNAGVARDNISIRMTEEEWDEVLNTNLRGAFQVCRASFGLLRRSGAGRIVNMSSVIGLIGNAGQANYAAAKAGLIGLTKSLAREYAGKKITVNAVAPGYIETDMTAALSTEMREAIVSRTPLGRLGTSDDVAPAVGGLRKDDAELHVAASSPTGCRAAGRRLKSPCFCGPRPACP